MHAKILVLGDISCSAPVVAAAMREGRPVPISGYLSLGTSTKSTASRRPFDRRRSSAADTPHRSVCISATVWQLPEISVDLAL